MTGLSPNWSLGYVPPVAEWNAKFAGKQDWSTILDAIVASGGVTFPIAGGQITGSLLLGTGTITGIPYQFQSATNFDPSAAGPSGSFSRKNMFTTTLSYAANTTNIWEGVTSFLTVNGPGQANGEINAFHGAHTYNAGATVLSAEGYESSVLNGGAITANFTHYLAQSHNLSTGTAVVLNGLSLTFQNDNVAAGAVGQYIAISNTPMTGAGSQPTFNYFIRNVDPTAVLNTLGQVSVGFLGFPPSGTLMQSVGLGSSSATYTYVAKNLAATNLFYIRDDGFLFLGPAVNTDSTGLKIGGADNSSGTFPFVVKNLAGTSILYTDNAGGVHAEKITPVTANLILGIGAALATNATTGMILIPTCAGTPTGNVGALGQAALAYDSAASKIWIGVAGVWKSVAIT